MIEPYGTVYKTFDRGEICIKDSPRGEPFGQSWWAIYTLPKVKNKNDYPGKIFINGNWEEDVKINIEIETETICTDDAIYNHDADMYYAVFNKDEINEMIDILKNAVEKLNKAGGEFGEAKQKTRVICS